MPSLVAKKSKGIPHPFIVGSQETQDLVQEHHQVSFIMCENSGVIFQFEDKAN